MYKKITLNGRNCFRLQNEVFLLNKIPGLHITAPFFQKIKISRINHSINKYQQIQKFKQNNNFTWNQKASKTVPKRKNQNVKL